MPAHAHRHRLLWTVSVFLVSLALLVAGVLLVLSPEGRETPRPEAAMLALTPTSSVEAEVREVPFGSAPGSIAGTDAMPAAYSAGTEPLMAVTTPQTVGGFATIGITWSPSSNLKSTFSVYVRTREPGRDWSPWEFAPYDAEHRPEEDETQAGSGRVGTEPVAVGRVESVQAKVVSAGDVLPNDLRLSLVDPGTPSSNEEEEPELGTDEDAEAGAVMAAGGASIPPRPRVFSRAQWGADERLRDRGSLRYGTVRAGFVHHTVNANDYARDDVPAIIRGIYAYHTRSLGWSDVGYNFLVDRFGRIWEGRYGGIGRAVVGAHTLGYNEQSFAMAAIGNLETRAPTAALIDAYAKLFAWKLALHRVAADDRRRMVAGDVFPAISGHRDAGQTACPGRYLYAKLGDIRRAARRIQVGAGNETPRRGKPLDTNLSGSSWPDLVVRDRRGRVFVVRTGGQMGFNPPVASPMRLRGVGQVAATGDLTRDGWGDLLVRTRSGPARLLTGSASGEFRWSARTYPKLDGVRQLTSIGDLDRDGDADVVGRRGNKLVLIPGGRRRGTLGAERILARDWGRFDRTLGVGDVTRDGFRDLVARSGDRLWLVRGRARSVSRPRLMPGRWGMFDRMVAGGDLTGDRLPDLIVRSAMSGRTYIYPGNGHGGWRARLAGWPHLRGDRRVVLGHFAPGRPADLVTVTERGLLRTYAHNGRTNISGIVATGLVWKGVDRIIKVGDWDRDGDGDVMTRRASDGALQLRPGRRGAPWFGRPVVVRRDWSRVSGITAVGDVTGDRLPDLMARTSDGLYRLYPGDGRRGLRAGIPMRRPVEGRIRVTVGRWDADRVPDTVVRRRDGSLWLYGTVRRSPRQIASGFGGYTWLLGLGDMNGDGRPDLIGRRGATGDVKLIPGTARGFGSPRTLATSFERFDLAG